MRRALLVFAVLALAAASDRAPAQDYAVGTLTIKHPWSRATPHGASVAAGYLEIENRGAVADRLVGISAPEIAGRFEIHEMAIQDGVARMRALPRGLEIAPGATAKLAPGGYHLMFMNLTRPLRQGERFKGRLVFEKAGAVDVEFTVEAMGARPHGH
jgi:copper(I)-binding protein